MELADWRIGGLADWRTSGTSGFCVLASDMGPDAGRAKTRGKNPLSFP